MSNRIDNLDSEAVIIAHHYKTTWLAANRGIFAQVAKQLSRRKPISKQMVRMVFLGERRSQRVERAFRRMRAPGFEVAHKSSLERKGARRQ